MGIWEFLEDVGCQAEHCIALLPRRHFWICILGLPPQGVSSILSQDELGRLLNAGIATAVVSFREPHLLCADLIEEVFGDHWVVERRQRVAVPYPGVVVGFLVVDDVLDAV